ncbi:MAG TPA: hypothetical protein VH867_02110 [Burkholderiales bacterium]
MITPSDVIYQQTKRLKRSGAPLDSPFKEIAEWIAAEYRVRVLNVVFDAATYDRPRLIVIADTQGDALKFQNSSLGDYDKIVQKRVQERFETILAEQDDHRFNIDGLFVVFAAFERVARIEANESVTKNDMDQLKAKLNNNDLWGISRLFDTVTFFFYTDAQVKHYEAAGLRDAYAGEYARLVQPHDEFGYLRRRGVLAYFDSKENFDTNYESNWYYYYK